MLAQERVYARSLAQANKKMEAEAAFREEVQSVNREKHANFPPPLPSDIDQRISNMVNNAFSPYKTTTLSIAKMMT